MTEALAYYNENDPAAAHVLRFLIGEGVIAPGMVDDRSIKEVDADDLRGFTQHHFFAGGGLWSVACRLAGWADARPIWTASCPCQPYSAAGKGLGADDPRHLWPDVYRLVRTTRERGFGPTVLVGEQTAGARGYGWFDGVRADLAREEIAARSVDFPACAVDAPHERNRQYWVALGRVGLADSEGFERRPGLREIRQEQDGAIASDAYGDGRGVTLGDAFGAGLERFARHGDERGRSIAARSVAEADGGDGSSSVGHGDDSRGLQSKRGEQGIGGRGSNANAGRNGTYWSDAEWIICHDSKARRAKPGIRFLVDGLPGRVDLWRIGGNAIVPEAAAEALRALIDVLPVWREAA